MDDTYTANTEEPRQLSLEQQISWMKLPAQKPFGTHRFETDKECLRHFRMILGWWYYERSRQFDTRAERMKAHDFVDGIQWTAEEKSELEERGQMAGVFNMMKATHDWLVGTERRMRYDFDVLPRRKEDSKSAETKTKLLKWQNSVNKARHARSLAFKDQVISGLGWIDIGIRSNDEEDPTYIRYEDWRNVWYDSAAKQWDLSDGRFLFKSRIVDFDVAVAMFPDRANVLFKSVGNQKNQLVDQFDDLEIDPELAELYGENFDPLGAGITRDRIRLVACEYRIPQPVKIMRGKDIGSLNGAIFDGANEGMAYLHKNGHCSLVDAVRMIHYRMVFTGNYILQWSRRKYNHNRFSMVPRWCYRMKSDGSPYGVAKQQIDPQVDLNKRRTKSLWLLSSNQVVIQDKNWVDYDDLIEEKDRPDGVMVVKDVKQFQLRDYSKSPQIRDHFQILEQDKRFIEAIGGVTDENRGVETNAKSGIAIRARQDQGHVNTAEVFDNNLLAFQYDGEIQLSLAEQFYTKEFVVRLTGRDGNLEFIEMNKPSPDGSRILNDITETQCDFVVDFTSYSATIRQMMFEQLGDMIGKIPPEIAVNLLDMWIDMSDLPGREAMVNRIRTMTGQQDPDEDPNDPQVVARKQAEAEEAKRQKEIMDMLAQLEIAIKEAEVKDKSASATKKLAEAKAALAKIKTTIDEIRIKKATALNAIEGRREQALLPAKTPSTPG